MRADLKPFIHGNILFIVCCFFYLAWWLIAFKPQGAVKGIKSGWLLIPAAVAGILAVYEIVIGIFGINMVNAAVSTAKICLAGVVVYVVLLLGTWFLMKRPVTTELILIVGWLTLVIAEINTLYHAEVFGQRAAVIFIIVSVVIALISLICYTAYYKLDVVNGYYDGMVPLVIVAVMSAAMLVAIG